MEDTVLTGGVSGDNLSGILDVGDTSSGTPYSSYVGDTKQFGDTILHSEGIKFGVPS